MEPVVQAEVSATLFELVHMELVSLYGHSDCKERQGKLELLGYQVGASISEQLTTEFPRFKNELDVLVFVCKQLWPHIWNKPVDNLKTNHQDVYVLFDNNFRLLTRVSGSDQYKEQAARYLAFPCGLIKGALSTLGIGCQVTAEVTKMPACIFQVKLTQ